MYIVKYLGTFAFIKPWTAVRDEETYSQQFLTQSSIAGIERKLFPELLKNDNGDIKKILRHKIDYDSIDIQQEVTWSKGGFHTTFIKKENRYSSNTSVIKRGVLINPVLYIAFANLEDANIAAKQHLCLGRNEDFMIPNEVFEISEKEFEDINGYELIFTDKENGFKVGHNRFKNGEEMYGNLIVTYNHIEI